MKFIVRSGEVYERNIMSSGMVNGDGMKMAACMFMMWKELGDL